MTIMLRPMAKQRGFSLIELIIALAVVGFLLSQGMPAYYSQVKNARLDSGAADFATALMYAKAEAVGRNDFVSVCRRNADGSACAVAGGWEQGWLTFVDGNADGAIGNGEEILFDHPALNNQVTARGSTGLETRITYRPNGMTSLTSTQAVVFCDERGFVPQSRGVVVTLLGKSSHLSAQDAAQADCRTGA